MLADSDAEALTEQSARTRRAHPRRSARLLTSVGGTDLPDDRPHRHRKLSQPDHHQRPGEGIASPILMGERKQHAAEKDEQRQQADSVYDLSEQLRSKDGYLSVGASVSQLRTLQRRVKAWRASVIIAFDDQWLRRNQLENPLQPEQSEAGARVQFEGGKKAAQPGKPQSQSMTVTGQPKAPQLSQGKAKAELDAGKSGG